MRLLAPAAGLAQAGHRVRVTRQPEPGDVNDFDTFVFARPMASPVLSLALMVCRQAGKRVIVDVDEDFHDLPPDHPEYARWGRGNPAALAALDLAVAQADVVTVASPVLAGTLSALCPAHLVVPSGWRRSNSLWDQPAPRRNTLNIGWIGGAADVADLEAIRPDVIRAGAPGARGSACPRRQPGCF